MLLSFQQHECFRKAYGGSNKTRRVTESLTNIQSKSKQMSANGRCLFFLLVSLSLSHSKPVANPQFPCKPPTHNTYSFCNISLPITRRAQSLISHLTLQEKIQQLSDNASGIPRLGIPRYEWWSESLHGIAINGPGVSFKNGGPVTSATGFPQVIVSAASFNRSLWFLIGSAISIEARAMYNVGQAGLTFWAPNINIFRDPRWGRGQETPGEDPMVASAYAIEFVRGFQGGNWKSGTETESTGRHRIGQTRVLLGEDGEINDDKLMLSACCKHSSAYDLEKWGNFSRYSFNAVVTEQDMEDTYQPPFRSCIQEGKASCLMCSYNEVNGVPACAREDLLQKTRTEWGFKGYITSDCDAVATIFEYQNYSKSPEDAVAMALKAGMDINCGTYVLRNAQSAVEKGKLQEKDIDRALHNLFSVQLRLGLFDGDPQKGQFGKLGPKNVCTKEHKTLALEAARQGIVLLKNDKKFLPLNKKAVSSLAIIGPLANKASSLGGDYTASKKPVILVLTGGGPLDVSFAKGDPRIASILWMGYPGEAGAKALAEIIFGEYNPDGRLPVTWYPESFTEVSMNDMNMRPNPSLGYPGRTYRFYTGNRVYGFGGGLSYTNFTYKILSAPSKLSLSGSLSANSRKRILQQGGERLSYIITNEITSCNSLRFNVRISVENVGNMDGGHVVMLFSRVPAVFRGSPEKQLVGFDRVHTISHRSTEMSILVDPCEHLSVANEQGKKIILLGGHALMLGDMEHFVTIQIY